MVILFKQVVQSESMEQSHKGPPPLPPSLPSCIPASLLPHISASHPLVCSQLPCPPLFHDIICGNVLVRFCPSGLLTFIPPCASGTHHCHVPLRAFLSSSVFSFVARLSVFFHCPRFSDSHHQATTRWITLDDANLNIFVSHRRSCCSLLTSCASKVSFMCHRGFFCFSEPAPFTSMHWKIDLPSYICAQDN